MKFDLFSLVQKRDESWTDRLTYERIGENIKLAEQMGFETAWFAEHHFNNYSLCPSPLFPCLYFAGKFHKIRFGTSVLVLPLYEPARIVQEIAQADVLTNGRLVVGIGAGYQDYEFVRFRVQLAEAVDRTIEMLDIIELGLTQEHFTYKGKYYQLPETQIAVKPVQKPMPEIWVAGLMGAPKMQRRVVESGYVPFLTPAWNPVESIKKTRDAYDEFYRANGKDPATMPLSLMRFVHVTKDKAKARDAAERARYSSRVSLSLRLNYAKINGIYCEDMPAPNEPAIEQMEKNYLIGDAETVAERIVHDYEVMKHSHMAVNVQLGGVPQEGTMASLEAMGSHVIPMVQKELARRGAKFPAIRQKPMAAEYQRKAAE
ncbi:MAG: LLM class flavin-dependent oxidoreductase [Alphaproteobacteria bacterium]|nr:LLM class flavin-dependent oxidoreductase [Alphaproteobacteria bacterium]